MENEITRKEQIHSKGFDMNNRYQDYSTVSDYKKIKVGVKQLEDAILNLGEFNSEKALRHPYGDKKTILKALIDKDIPTLRAISNFYY